MTLAPGGEKEMEFTVEGQKPGEADLEVTVSSSTTGKRAEATMNVVVVNPNPTDGFMEFLTRILGMS
ncbi:MAG: hypothetical protein SVS85_01670 [Candidatus Nanohaloarchaea archaeon]|nr:hypothetical protein [Candidatus Nanohaloarchaea archaeon]